MIFNSFFKLRYFTAVCIYLIYLIKFVKLQLECIQIDRLMLFNKINSFMSFYTHLRLSFVLPFILLSFYTSAQLVNYEETWQEFLKNPKTSKISELAKPSKDQDANYLKWCLMNANSFYCADNLMGATPLINEIESFPKELRDNIPSFSPRFGKLKKDVAAYKACGEIWKRFIMGELIPSEAMKTSDVAPAMKVCEKGTLSKYFYITAHNYYCAGDLENSRNHFVNRVQKLVDKTDFKPEDVEGMPDRVDKMRSLWIAIDALNPAWKELMETNQSPGFNQNVPLYDCYTIPNMKEYILRASADYCNIGNEMLQKIKKLQAVNTHKIPTDVQEKIDWLEEIVRKNKDGLEALNAAWNKFSPKNQSKGLNYEYEFDCDKSAEIKAYIMDGFKDLCNNAQDALNKISELRKTNNPVIDAAMLEKIQLLEQFLEKEANNLSVLNETWSDFLPDDELSNPLNITFEYCDPNNTLKAYIMDGTIHFCEKGKQRLEDIAVLLKGNNIEASGDVMKKLEQLKIRQAQSEQDLVYLKEAWNLHVRFDDQMVWDEGFPTKDSLIRDSIKLVEFYCDKIAQVKSWTIIGHLDPCINGEAYYNRIQEYKKEHKLDFDEELNCEISRLYSKIYQCKYWELVLKAWQLTYDECQRFGPLSSQIMYNDLNSDELPCETTVDFKMLGKIGIQYTITAYLCQKINLAQMGDPEYYKKIAKWVDEEVLMKYCNTSNWRCKKDFFIYLEGHTDGYRFNGRKYDQSLDIPEGTPYTHFIGKADSLPADTLQKETRNITRDLKSNMELGIARAWTVKQQLDFMEVPITIGAYEHPESEKGGEYRRIEIELNITNLMLDYFEKTLKELIDASGIGDRPQLDC